MSLIIRCPDCKRNNRFKGKNSQISRGKSFVCSNCQGKISLSKKPNGKVIVSDDKKGERNRWKRKKILQNRSS